MIDLIIITSLAIQYQPPLFRHLSQIINQLDMPKANTLGDILCMLSGQPSETWGLVVNEAMACGRPVIVSEMCGCVPDLVEGKNTGWVVKSNNFLDTSNAISISFNNISEWQNIGL